MVKNILIVWGGGGSEHEISCISAKFIHDTLCNNSNLKLFLVELTAEGTLKDSQYEYELTSTRYLNTLNSGHSIKIDYCIPYIHGNKGEDGQFSALLEVFSIPYLGPLPESHALCFNKISAKLWFSALGIPNTPFLIVEDNSIENRERIHDFFETHKEIYIKAASQGSSRGCYYVNNKNDIENKLNEAFQYSSYVVVEKNIQARELEISVYEYNGVLYVTNPGEIIVPSKFYTYEEKYSKNSHTQTLVEAPNIDQEIVEEMKNIARKAFIGLKLRHLSRVDFFLTQNNEILLNEINTFPGMTPISMFPKMMEHNGTKLEDFLIDKIFQG